MKLLKKFKSTLIILILSVLSLPCISSAEDFQIVHLLDGNDYLSMGVPEEGSQQVQITYEGTEGPVEKLLDASDEIKFNFFEFVLQNEGTPFETEVIEQRALNFDVTRESNGFFRVQLPDFSEAHRLYLIIKSEQDDPGNGSVQHLLLADSTITLYSSGAQLKALQVDQGPPPENPQLGQFISVQTINIEEGNPVLFNKDQSSLLKIKFRASSALKLPTIGVKFNDIDKKPDDGEGDPSAGVTHSADYWEGWTCSFDPNSRPQSNRDLMAFILIGFGILYPLFRAFLKKA